MSRRSTSATAHKSEMSWGNKSVDQEKTQNKCERLEMIRHNSTHDTPNQTTRQPTPLSYCCHEKCYKTAGSTPGRTASILKLVPGILKSKRGLDALKKTGLLPRIFGCHAKRYCVPVFHATLSANGSNFWGFPRGSKRSSHLRIVGSHTTHPSRVSA